MDSDRLTYMNAIAKKLEATTNFVVQNLPADEVIGLIVAKGATSIIQENSPDFELEKQFVKTIEQNASSFFSDPLKTILGASLIDQTQINFKESVQKSETIEKVKAWLSGVKGAKRLDDAIYLIVDELFTNAIYNALPFFVGLNDGLDRREKVDLTDRKTCKLFVGYNERRLILGCSDSFGSLNIVKLITQLHSTYLKGIAGSIKYGAGGAGVGSRLMFDSCINFYIGVREHEQTTVALGLPIGPNARGIDTSFKNIHLIRSNE